MVFNPKTGKQFCSAKCWLPQGQNTQQGVSTPQIRASQSETVVITRTERPHSYETGKASNRHKIYYDTVPELMQHLTQLKSIGVLDDESMGDEDENTK